MDRSKKIQIGLLVLVAALLVANFALGGFDAWFGQSEGDKIREAAEASTPQAPSPFSASGNIPGMNEGTTTPPNVPTTTIKYDQTVYDFGVADEGAIVKHVFKFTNTGKEPLIISNARGSCGCTVPIWPKQPIPPGGRGEIVVEFDTKGKPGRQTKHVTVTANTIPAETHLEITGEVRGKEQAAKGGK
ncbi:MAG: DUF1573 domain-containing protein [Saprospiraceae bacterium]|nr:DUF1573 domain-containing protein [Saprospiraceae bacterium]MDW8483292.1 DUF1573 domain-containing protein [Saprospiraceae bacterium]